MNSFEKLALVFTLYSAITYLIFPYLYFYFIERSIRGKGYGYIIGSLLCIFLWLFYGKKYVEQ